MISWISGLDIWAGYLSWISEPDGDPERAKVQALNGNIRVLAYILFVEMQEMEYYTECRRWNHYYISVHLLHLYFSSIDIPQHHHPMMFLTGDAWL